MKRYIIYFLIITLPTIASAQSKTTQALEKKHSDAMALFFYNNTLRMLNQKEDKDFDELIKDIEKMKLLIINKTPSSFDGKSYKQLVADYKAEAFEEMMTSRHDGKSFDVFMKDGKNKGMLVLINDEESLYVLDIVGSLALNKVTSLYNTLDESSDIGQRIKAFTSGGDKEKNSEESDH